MEMESVIAYGHYLDGAEHLGERALQKLAVLKHVRDTRGGAQVVFQDVEVSVRMSYQVRSRDVTPDILRRGKTDAVKAKLSARENKLLRNNLVPQNLPVVVYVVYEEIKRVDSLFEAPFYEFPVLGRYYPRNYVKGEDVFLGSLLLFRVEGEGDPHLKQVHLGRFLPLDKFSF